MERQDILEKGEMNFPPLIIYPEGATTNNKVIMKFKKGAFFGLRSVQPVVYKYWAPLISPAHDIMNVICHASYTLMNPFMVLKVKEYPVFKPNDYFFANH
jgi:lysophosphatidylcholine acyltransferase/lyso-PAF acetyltransferase